MATPLWAATAPRVGKSSADDVLSFDEKRDVAEHALEDEPPVATAATFLLHELWGGSREGEVTSSFCNIYEPLISTIVQSLCAVKFYKWGGFKMLLQFCGNKRYGSQVVLW